MTPEKLALAMDMLTRPVPPPAQPRPKPQDSFAQLKTGQMLTSLTTFYIGTIKFPVGTIWHVVDVDSLGAKLSVIISDQSDSTRSRFAASFTLTDCDWRGKLFARWKKPPKAKGKRK